MTAVEWFALNARKLRIQLEKKEITIGEFAVEHYNLLDKAKEMEKQQIEDAYTYGQKNIIDILSKEFKFSFAKTNEELRKVIENKENNEDADKYYNETYKKTTP